MINLETAPTPDSAFITQLNELPPGMKSINGYNLLEQIPTSSRYNSIYRAEGPNNLEVLLKLQRSSQPFFNWRFRREVALQERASQLSPFVVPIENSGSVTLPFTNSDGNPDEGEFPYLVTPFFSDGAMIRASSPKNRDHLLNVGLLTVGLGLDAFGEAIVHRDISPINVLMKHGRGYITDFGIAVPEGKIPEYRGGNPLFMAPEQTEDSPAVHETDVRAAAVLAHDIHRRIPFMSLNTSERSHLLQFEWAYDSYLHQKLTGLETPLRDVFGRALAFNPRDRYHQFADFYVDFQRARAHPNTPTIIFQAGK